MHHLAVRSLPLRALWCVSSILIACTGTPVTQDANNADASDVATDALPMTDTPVIMMDVAPVTPMAMWQLPRSGPNAFALPWPSDVTLYSDGTANLHFVPNTVNNPFVTHYEDALDHRLAGFSPVASTFFRFTVPIDTTTLPANEASTIEASSTIQLIDVDANSSERGTRHPCQWYFRETSSRYWTPNTLAIAPSYGFPLRPRTRYALVVTRGVHPRTGTFLRDADLDAVLASSGGDANVAAARAIHEPAVTEVEALGIPRDQILSIAVFTTNDPASELFRAVERVRTYDAPMFRDIARTYMSAAYVRYDGHYGPNPIFQSGAQPYDTPGTGDFIVDANGVPQVQDHQDFAFTLTTPPGEPPANGWPIVIYAHGTGGDSTSFVSDGTARSLAAQGMAVFGFDQIFNGARAIGGPAQAPVQFFNFTNPLAGRNNNRQAAIDLAQAGRMVRSMRIPSNVSLSGAEVAFDPAHVMFFGHSQGGLNGPLWLAAENGAGAAVLSGAGGTLALSITQKTEPINVPQVVAVVLGLPTASAQQELVPFHPVIALAQTVVDVADPVNYARYIIREPRTGNPPRHIYQTEGFVDHYAPDQGIESVAMAIGLPLVGAVLHPVATYGLTGQPMLTPPVSLNLANAMATGGWQQFEMQAGSDGHFVVFDIQEARDRAAGFLGTYAHDSAGGPTLP